MNLSRNPIPRTGRTSLALAVLSAVATAAVAGCGERHETLSASSRHSITLMLDFFPNADHAGIYRAQAEGDFRAAGLDVHVRVPGDPAEPLKLLAAGTIDAAISYEPEVLLARDRGQPVVSVAALVQRPLTSIISIGRHPVRSPAQLRGKRVGDAGIPYQKAELATILDRAGIPADAVSEPNVGFDLVPAMISGKVDATLGGYWNYEGIQLAREHRRPTVIPVDRAGVPSYDELVLAVSRRALTTRTNDLRALLQGLSRGYESVRKDPSAAVDELVRANPGLDRGLQLASVHATLNAFFPSGAHPWGWQDAGQWDRFGAWMLDHHLVSRAAAVADASTNELLAGQGPP